MVNLSKGRLASLLLAGDKRLLQFIYDEISCRGLNIVMPYVTHLGGARFSIAISFLVFFLVDQSLGLEMGLVLGLSHLTVHIIKRIAHRPRPCASLKSIKEVVIPFEPHSFPSGHTTASFSLAITLGFYFPVFKWSFIILASLVGISRVYLGVHYPSDILMGGLLGTFFAYLIHFVIFL